MITTTTAMGVYFSKKFDASEDLFDLTGKVVIVTGGKYVLILVATHQISLPSFLVLALATQQFNISHVVVLKSTWLRERNQRRQVQSPNSKPKVWVLDKSISSS
jgi:hypothetical protein